MKTKLLFKLLLLIGGVALIGVSVYIKQQVAAGTLQVDEAQGKVNTVGKLFSLTPETKGIGQQVTRPAQKKIDAGKEEIAQYQQLANWLLIGGIVLVIGGGFLLYRR